MYRLFQQWRAYYSQELSLRVLEDSTDPRAIRLAGVLRGPEAWTGSEQSLFQGVEEWRRITRQRFDPLIDASLGEPGPYDEGQSIGDACGASKNLPEALILYRLVKEFKPKSVIELGTNLGVSSCYLAMGLEKSARLATLEASPYRLRIARELHQFVNLSNVHYHQGLFCDELPMLLPELAPIDMAFIDGHHQYAPTLDYLETILRFCATDCLFLFDDTSWSKGMQRAWRRISEHPSIAIAVEFRGMGFCVAGSGQADDRRRNAVAGRSADHAHI